MKIIPDGKKMLVLPLPTEEIKVDSIIIPDSVATADLSRGEVVEVSKDLSHKFSKGDIVLYASKSGSGQIYKGVPHRWLIEREFDSDIWGKEVNE